MKQRFTIATVLVFFTLCSLGQKKEMMQNNFRGTDKLKPRTDLQFSHSINLEKHEGRQTCFLSLIAKTIKPSINKSNQELKQRLDSLVGHTLNNEPEYKEIYTYNSNGNMTQVIDYGWDSNTNTWVSNSKYNYTFDSNGNTTQEIYSEWDSNINAWFAEDKTDYTYDSSGNMTQLIYYGWDSNSNAWFAYWKYNLTYNPSGNITQAIEYEWASTTTTWVATLKHDFTYDSGGNMTQEIDYTWDSSANDWIAYFKIDCTYDSSWNMTQYIGYSWDSNTSAWVASMKSDLTYDATGNMIQVIESDWNNNINLWVAYYKSDYSYDANGNPTLEIYYHWDETTSQLKQSSKYDYTYDLSYNLPNLILPPAEWFVPDFSDKIINKPLDYSSYYWDELTSSWLIENNGIYYYTEVNTNSITETIDLGIEIYPNPVSEYINVSGITDNATFELYTMPGVLVLSKTLIANERLNVAGLSSGVYFYTLTMDRKQQTGKLTKK